MSTDTCVWLLVAFAVVFSAIGGFISYRTVKMIRKLEEEYL